MITSASIAALAPALVKAQGQIKHALKDSTNPHFRSKYADLSSIWEACRKPLTDNGLAIVQGAGIVANGILPITTRLIHTSGEWLEETAGIPIGKLDPQGYGSAVTYGKRYSLAAMVGVVADEDDDGNGATNQTQRTQADPAPRQESRPAPKGNGKGFPAKFAGKCGECGGNVAQGESVEFIPGTQPKKIRHLDCGADSQPNDEIPFPDHP